MNRNIPLIVFTLLISSLFYGADQFLQSSLELAENRDKKLIVAKEQLAIADLRIVRSGRSFFPGIVLQSKVSQGKTQLTSTGSTGEYISEYQAQEIGVRASQPIYDGGRLRASYKYDRMYHDSAQLSYAKAREELYYRVKSAYYELLTARSELRRMKDAYSEIRKLAEKSQLEYNVKAISDLDLQDARIFSDKVENMYASAQMNAQLLEKKLLLTIDATSLDEIAVPLTEESLIPPDDLSYTEEEVRRFVTMNNVDVRIYQLYIDMNKQKAVIAQAKAIPRIYLEGFYGRSGEAFVQDVLPLTTVWTVMGRLSWTLWANSLEANISQDKTAPSEIIDISQKTDNLTREVKLALFDDLNYFVESKESDVALLQSKSDYKDTVNKAEYEFERYYNEYQQSLWSARTAKNEIKLRERKLEVLRKRNELYEVSTLEVMDGVYKYAETLVSYTKALATNYLAVCELERLALMPLR